MQLNEMFPNIELHLIETLLEISNGDAEAAATMMLEETTRGGYVESTTTEYVSHEALSALPCLTTNYKNVDKEEKHLEKTNVFVKILHATENEILNCYKRCLVCNSEVEFMGTRPTVCSGALW